MGDQPGVNLKFKEDINLNVCIEDLQSDHKIERKKALEKIKENVLDNDYLYLISMFPTINTYILRCFADQAETCRELSLDIIAHFIDNLPLSDYYLTYIIPVIAKRIGQPETIEESEELRLKLILLTKNIILRYKDTICLMPFFNDLTNILVKTSGDKYAKVKIETCETIILLSIAVKRDFHMQSESFVKPVIANFAHQQYRVRVAAIKAIGSIVMNGNAKCFEDSITPMAEKLFDEMGYVRVQVIREVGQWMLNYRDRYSFWHRMIPLLLTGLSDAQPDIQRETSELWDQIGKQYVNENEEELKPLLDFQREEPPHYPPVPRPNLGCRTLVERNISKIIPAIARELEGWQADARLRASQLMCWLVLCAESSIIQHAAGATKCFFLGAKTEDVHVNIEIYRASELLGFFVNPEVWWELLSPEIENWPCLGILANIIKGTEPDKLKTSYLKKISKKLSKPHRCRTRKSKYQLYLLKTCENLLKVCGEDCKKVSQELFDIIFTVYAMPAENDLELQALCLLEKLRSTIKCGSDLNDLFCKYVSSQLRNITSDACLWTLQTPERCILDAILVHTGPALGLNLHLLSPLLVEALSSKEIDAEVKLKLLTSLSSVLLNRNHNFIHASEKHLRAFLNIILNDAITPNLIWSAGRTAEAIRTAAICCLCATLQDNEMLDPSADDEDRMKSVKAIELFPSKESLEPHVDKLLQLLISLVDDNSYATRLYTLRAVCSLTKLVRKKDCFTFDHLHQTYPVVMKRLDDNNDSVRLAAVQTLCLLFLMRPEPYDLDTFGSHLDALYTAMLIHLDDPAEDFQNETLAALKELSEIHPKMLKKKVGAKMNLFRNKMALESLDKHLESLSI